MTDTTAIKQSLAVEYQRLREGWTVDAEGNRVNWLQDQYCNAEAGSVDLVLAGETYNDLALAERTRRVAEYYHLLKRKTVAAQELKQQESLFD